VPKTRTLGFRLAQTRREKQVADERDIDFGEIAKAARVSISTYSRYEADITKPDDDTLGLLASYYGVTRSWLRFGEGDKYPPPKTVIRVQDEQGDPVPDRGSARSADRAAGGQRGRGRHGR
jgi:transcriptional regulator with XRE-family HTH domain